MLESQLLFIDTETTGATAEDRICQVAYKYRNETAEQLFKPPLPIKLVAMAVTHITNEMVDDKTPFATSFMRTKLTEYIKDSAILVAHNADFDVSMLKKDGVVPTAVICTLKLARHLDKGGKYENHQLQYLRYFYGLTFDTEINAHDALSDVLVLEKVFEKLIEELRAIEGLTHDEAVLRAIEISKLPSEFRKFNFGKYTGSTIEEVKRGGFDGKGRQWMEWLLVEKLKRPEGDEDWIYTLTKALQ